MYYVYLLRSITNPDKTYIGFTSNLRQRLESHNSGNAFHTVEFRPWHLVTYTAFDSKAKAMEFEKYLKIGSGHSFARRHFW
jgi:putative endonuclease